MLFFLEWIFGYVTLEVIGESVEQFMNLCSVHNKDVWDFFVTPQGIRINVRMSEVKSLRSIAKKCRVRIQIKEKHGLWFALKPVFHRWGMMIGIFVFCFLLWFLSSRIWYIDIQGNYNVSTSQAQEMLCEVGVLEGVKKKGFDWATIRQTILMKHPEISWMALNLQGCILQVDITETSTPPQKLQNSEPSNLLATRDGRVIDLQVNVGKAMVKKGDAVVKGDVLISGAVEYSDGTTVLRSADGIVMAETKYKKSVHIPFEQIEYLKTGRKKVKRVFNCFGVEVPLFLGSVPKPYSKVTEEKSLRIRNITLPLKIQKAEFFEIKPTTIYKTKEEAKQQGRMKIEEEIYSKFQREDVKKIDYKYQLTDTGIEVKCEFFCIENIIFREKMLIF